MSQSSDGSAPLANEKVGFAYPWLEEQVYAPKRQHTYELVKQAIDALRADEKKHISLSTIEAKTRELDPEGKGISQSAILGNQQAYTYYQKHRNFKPSNNRKNSAKRATATNGDADQFPNHLLGIPDLNRNQARVARRYMQFSKPELVKRLIAVEQAIAEQEVRFNALNDQLLEWQLRVEQAERRDQPGNKNSDFSRLLHEKYFKGKEIDPWNV
jgi:hypothetical protein